MGSEIKQGTQPNIGSTFSVVEDASGVRGSYSDQYAVQAPIVKFSVARTDPPGTVKAYVHPNFTPAQIRVFGPGTTNAGTTATVQIGVDTTSNYFLTLDVKASTGIGYQTPQPLSVLQTMFVALPNNVHPILGGYAEGATSTAGGPWTVEIEGYVP